MAFVPNGSHDSLLDLLTSNGSVSILLMFHSMCHFDSKNSAVCGSSLRCNLGGMPNKNKWAVEAQTKKKREDKNIFLKTFVHVLSV